MKEYYYPALFFKKKWVWFSDPYDVDNTDMVNFFSYNDLDVDGFKKKEGLTTVIDLSEEFDEIWNGMRKNFIRKQIQRGERNGVIVEHDVNFEGFFKIYKNFRQYKNITYDKFQAFKKNGLLFSAYYEGKMVAGGVFISDGEYMRAWALASLRLNRLNGRLKDLIGQSSRMIISEAIKYAKKSNHALFDFGGIRPDSEDQSQRSLAEFKEAFGGKRIKCFYYYKIYSKPLRFFYNLKRICF